MTSLRDLHLQIMQDEQLIQMLNDEVTSQRHVIIKRIKQIIEAYRKYSLELAFAIKMDATRQIIIGNTMKDVVYDSTSQLPYHVETSRKIQKFLKVLFDYSDVICLFIDYYFSEKNPNFSAHPCQSSISFLSASTLPALFGYCWCVEQGVAYIDFICKLISLQKKRYVNVMTSGFRNSYVKDIVRHFLRLVGTQDYFKLSLSDKIFKFFYDDSLATMKINSKEYIEKLIEYVDLITNGLIQALPYAPPLFRYFFKKMYDVINEDKNTCDNANQGFLAVKNFFLDVVLLPALLNSVQYGLLSYAREDINKTHTVYLMKVTNYAADEETIPEHERQNYMNNEMFLQLKTKKLIEKLCVYEEPIKGLRLSQIQKLIDEGSNYIRISVNDVLFLKDIIQTSKSFVHYEQKTRGEIAALALFEELDNFKEKELIDFWYQYYVLPPISEKLKDGNEITIQYKHPLFNSREVKLDKKPPSSNDSVLKLLVLYLESIPIMPYTTNNIFDFLEAQKKWAAEYMNPQLSSRTEAMITKLRNTHLRSDEILRKLRDLVNRNVDNHSSLFDKSFQHQMVTASCSKLLDNIKRYSQELEPFFCQSIVNEFKLKSKASFERIKENKLQIVQNASDWASEFLKLSQELTNYLNMKKYELPGKELKIRKQLHSACFEIIEYQEYRQMHRDLQSKDQKIRNNYDYILESFQKDQYSKELQGLFSSPSTFTSVCQLLRDGTRFGDPLERADKIGSVIKALHDIYTFDTGDECSGDDFVPLFIFTILQAKIEDLASLSGYLDQFLLSIDTSASVLQDQEKYIVTSFVSAVDHIVSLASQIKRK